MSNKGNILIFAKYALAILTFIGAWLLYAIIYFDINFKKVHSENDFTTYHDSSYHFKINIPKNWDSSKTESDTTFFRLHFNSTDNKQAISIYAFKANSRIELSALASNSDKLFTGLGQIISENDKVIKYFRKQNKIVKTYYNGSLYTKLFYKKNYNIGYIIYYQSVNNNFKDYELITKSFISDVPLKDKLATWKKGIFKGIVEWIVGIVLSLIGIFILYHIGKFGQLFRKGVKLKIELIRIKKDIIKKGKIVDKNWIVYNKKSNLWIILPLTSLLIFYTSFFLLVSLKIFLISLIGVVIFTLGYLNIFFVPSSDMEDYLP